MTTDNKALADRLTSMASCITPGGLNDAEIALMREAAAALTSPQADKARGEVEREVRYWLDNLPNAIRVREGAGDECLAKSFAVNIAALPTPQPQGDAGPDSAPVVDEATARRLDDYLGGEFDIRIGKQAAHAALHFALTNQPAATPQVSGGGDEIMLAHENLIAEHAALKARMDIVDGLSADWRAGHAAGFNDGRYTEKKIAEESGQEHPLIAAVKRLGLTSTAVFIDDRRVSITEQDVIRLAALSTASKGD